MIWAPFVACFCIFQLVPEPVLCKKASVASLQYKQANTHPVTIQEKIEQIARSIPGDVGISALHFESGQRIAFNNQKSLPMASVCKLAVAVKCLELVDAGKLSLNEKFSLHANDLWQIDWVDRQQLRTKHVVNRSLDELLKKMISVSDNPATDIVLRLIGGVDAVNACLREHGIAGMTLNRSILKLVGDYCGITQLHDPYHCTYTHYEALKKRVKRSEQKKAEMQFYDDKRDTSTTDATNDLLAKLFAGKLLCPSSTQFLLSCMELSQMCTNRIGGLLPDGTKVMHKSGGMVGVTDYGLTNDIGIFQLPGGKGHIILSVFINKARASKEKRKKTIAQIAKALFDHFSKPVDSLNK